MSNTTLSDEVLKELVKIGRRKDAARIACMIRLGILNDATPLQDVWMDIWPRVWGDPIVAERAEAMRKANRSRFSFAVEAVNAMSKSERLALRDRVLGV